MERRNKPSRGRDNIYFGAFLGLVFPMIGFLLFYVFAFSGEMSLQDFWDGLFGNSRMSAMLSLSIVANLPVFFFCITNKRYETAKGVIGATIFYGVFIILFKFS